MKRVKFFKAGSYEDLQNKIDKWIEEESPHIIQINPIYFSEFGSYMQILYEIQILDLGENNF
jgi:hypothetical protein